MNRKHNSQELPSIEPSPLRDLMSQAGKIEFRPVKSFFEAKKYTDAYVIFEGDGGGQIYLSCPMKLVRCSEKALQKLLLKIDEKQWKDPSMAHISYERMTVGEIIAGGMDGGVATEGVWLHPEIEQLRPMIENRLFKKWVFIF